MSVTRQTEKTLASSSNTEQLNEHFEKWQTMTSAKWQVWAVKCQIYKSRRGAKKRML
jgi:hypothetical protein